MNRLVTNSVALLADAQSWGIAEGKLLGDRPTGLEIRGAMRWLADGGALIVDTDSRLTLQCALASLLHPQRRWRLVSLDLVLATPERAAAKLAARAKGLLYRRADLFILYFRDTAGYSRLYGVPADRVRYVPFKVNSWSLLPTASAQQSPGDYLLCAGRSRRDLDVFLAAAAMSGLPCVLVHQDVETLRQHGTRLELSRVPTGVRVEHDQGGAESWVRWLSGARALVVPVLPGTIGASGISTYLDAMALGKPVIISRCPAVNQLLDNEALIVPSGDAFALATAMRLVWNDAPLRERLVQGGLALALSRGGATRLHRDILSLVFPGPSSN